MSIKMILTATFICLLFYAEVSSGLKWCTESGTYSNCTKLQAQLAGFECVKGDSEEDCYKQIAEKKADLGVFDGGSIYHAGKTHGLKVVMAENLGGGFGTAYYAIAAVNANSSLSLNGLKGKKSCHTGVQKTSGWVVPVATLLRKKYMPWVECDQYKSVASYFDGSCAPGSKDPKYNKDKSITGKLCQLCNGTGADNCARSSKEPYYGYSGAFKCLQDGKGDVAFIKASILTSLNPVEQAKYKILCMDNTKAAPNTFSSCNLARVPSHAVLARKDTNITAYQVFLRNATTVFQKYHPYGMGLFSKSTSRLDPVPSNKQAYDKYLDAEYMQDIKTLESCVPGAANLARADAWLFAMLLSIYAFFSAF